MIVYWITSFFSVILTFLDKKVKMKRSTLILISGFPLFIISALRYGIGADYFSYVNMYNEYFRYGIRGRIEPLFFQLNKAIAYFDLDIQWLFVICSAIIIYFIVHFIFENSTNEAFSIFLFVGLTYYMGSFNVMRQFLSIAICLFAIQYIKKQKFISFCLCIFVAMGFHYLAITFVVVYLFRYKSISPRLGLVLSVVFGFCIQILSTIVIDVLLNTRYGYILDSEELGGSNAIWGMIIQICILLFASMYYDKTDDRFKLFYSIQFVSLWLSMFGNHIPLIGRVCWYFELCSIVLIPLTISKIKNQKERFLWIGAILVIVFIYAQIVVAVLGSYGCLPYESIL